MVKRERFRSLVSRSVPRLVIVCALGGLTTACSSDALRFTDNPFGNPFSSGTQETTGTVTPAPLKAPVSAVHAQPLGSPVSSAPLPPPSAAPGMPKVAAAVPAAPAVPLSGPVAQAPKGWSAQGGSQVTLGAGETLATLSNRYGVPEQALRAANGLQAKGQPAAGTSLIIPVYNAVGSAEAPSAAPVAAASAVPKVTPPAPVPAGHRLQLVKGAQPAQATASSPAPVKVATAAPVPVPAKAVVAKPTPVATAPAAKPPVAKAAAPQVVATAAPVKPVSETPKPVEAPKVAAAAQPLKAAAPAVEAAETTASVAAPAATASSGSGEFRWPAKGRIISSFGGKGGGSNDGINIALPEGTPVKAAEGGVVKYAGNELKGYGNLVLIQHPDGWVSAYAHNGDLKVKRGDQVSRGQTIASSGQSGNVSSPQLHFELRKNAQPVDPLTHLSGL